MRYEVLYINKFVNDEKVQILWDDGENHTNECEVLDQEVCGLLLSDFENWRHKYKAWIIFHDQENCYLSIDIEKDFKNEQTNTKKI